MFLAENCIYEAPKRQIQCLFVFVAFSLVGWRDFFELPETNIGFHVLCLVSERDRFPSPNHIIAQNMQTEKLYNRRENAVTFLLCCFFSLLTSKKSKRITNINPAVTIA